MDTRLSSYAKYASAVAVTVVAPSATGEIIYNDLSVSVSANHFGRVNLLTGGHTTGLGVDGGAGSASFSFRWYSFRTTVYGSSPAQFYYRAVDRWDIGGGLDQRIGPPDDVAAMNANQQIDGDGSWTSANRLKSILFTQFGYSFTGRSYGLWDFNTSAYVGFQFNIEGEARYAWAELTITGYALELSGYAYDDAGNPIQAGQIPAPGGIGLLALAAGAGGIRRRRFGSPGSSN